MSELCLLHSLSLFSKFLMSTDSSHNHKKHLNYKLRVVLREWYPGDGPTGQGGAGRGGGEICASLPWADFWVWDKPLGTQLHLLPAGRWTLRLQVMGGHGRKNISLLVSPKGPALWAVLSES